MAEVQFRGSVGNFCDGWSSMQGWGWHFIWGIKYFAGVGFVFCGMDEVQCRGRVGKGDVQCKGRVGMFCEGWSIVQR